MTYAPPAKATLNGQVFVVTKGRDNIKLALVEVAAIPENLVLEHVHKKHELGLVEQHKIEGQIATAMKESAAEAPSAFRLAWLESPWPRLWADW